VEQIVNPLKLDTKDTAFDGDAKYIDQDEFKDVPLRFDDAQEIKERTCTNNDADCRFHKTNKEQVVVSTDADIQAHNLNRFEDWINLEKNAAS